MQIPCESLCEKINPKLAKMGENVQKLKNTETPIIKDIRVYEVIMKLEGLVF